MTRSPHSHPAKKRNLALFAKLAKPMQAKTVWYALAALVLPIIWVSAVPRPERSWHPERTTGQRLVANERLIHSFMKDLGEAPPSLAELKVFARATGQSFSSYDGYGERLDYLRLDQEHFTLRSFGRDGIQNTLMSAPDDGVYKSGKLPQSSLVYEYSTPPELSLYPAALLLGADSPNHVWHARLFSDQAAGNRRLLVRRRDQSNLHMFAPHDGVEEFLWLPTGYQIVFTATGSARYRDGVYLWNLLDDSLQNLLDLEHASPSANKGNAATSTEKNYFVSLAGISVAPQVVHAFVAERSLAPLDPVQFFSAARLRSFLIPEREGTAATRTDLQLATGLNSLTKSADLAANLEGFAAGTKTQNDWLHLRLEGDQETTLLQWQEFTEKQADSPLFPYALWYLSSLYGDAFAVAAVPDPNAKTPEVLRSFASELAKALVNLPLAPHYLRALAFYSYETLMQKQKLPYAISDFERAAKSVAPRTKKHKSAP